MSVRVGKDWGDRLNDSTQLVCTWLALVVLLWPGNGKRLCCFFLKYLVFPRGAKLLNRRCFVCQPQTNQVILKTYPMLFSARASVNFGVLSWVLSQSSPGHFRRSLHPDLISRWARGLMLGHLNGRDVHHHIKLWRWLQVSRTIVECFLSRR